MKVLLLVDDYLPGSIKIAARMMHDLALELINQGHEVSVCTPDDHSYGLMSVGALCHLMFWTYVVNWLNSAETNWL